jgi:Lon protease-like protein
MADELLNLPELVPLFPLPGVVLFPHTIIPLHIFEPRYREMTADALAGERVLAIALLKPGWEPLYYTARAPIHQTVGVGHILESEQVAEGNYNVLLRGVGRALVLEELGERAYRRARVQPVETYCSADDTSAGELRSALFAAIRRNPGLDPGLRRQWLRLRDADVPLNELADLLAAGVPGDAELRQCLLDEADALVRGQMLLEQIRVLGEVSRNMHRADRPGQHSLN